MIQPPKRPTTVVIAVTLGVVVTGLFLLPLPDGGRAIRACQDLVHAPIFALLGAALFIGLSRLPRRRILAAALMAGGLAVGTGVVLELLQKLTGRTASWQDVLADALGAAAGILWAAQRGTKRQPVPATHQHATALIPRWSAKFAAVLVLIAASVRPLSVIADSLLQHWDMPLLGSFEYSWEPSRWDAIDCRLRRDREHATAGVRALRVELQPGQYPGIDLNCPPADWSAYNELIFDAAVDDSHPLALIVKIKDKQHNNQPDDRFHERIVLSADMHRFAIPLDRVKAAPATREMDLRHITSLQFFAVNLSQQRTFFLDNVHLR